MGAKSSTGTRLRVNTARDDKEGVRALPSYRSEPSSDIEECVLPQTEPHPQSVRERLRSHGAEHKAGVSRISKARPHELASAPLF